MYLYIQGILWVVPKKWIGLALMLSGLIHFHILTISGDSLGFHNGMPFTTKDQDNDLEKNLNCAQKYHGGWWYKNCHQVRRAEIYGWNRRSE